MNLRSKVVKLASFSERTTKKKITSDTISHLITKCKWKKLLKVLQSCDKHQIECDKCSNSHSFLHLACRFDPPLSVIQVLLIGNPHSILEQDCQYRFPLHIAVMNGARIEVIDFLLRHNREAASAQDCEGKTPLHLLFTHYCENVDSCFFEGYVIVNTSEIAKLICRRAPNSVIVEDFEGMTALEYAIEKEACFDVVRVLQKASVRVMMKCRFNGCSINEGKIEGSNNGRRHSMTRRTEQMRTVTNPAA